MQKILEKGKVNLSRSKSELGEQHKKMISHLTKGRSEISEQNRKLMASLSKGGAKLIPQSLQGMMMMSKNNGEQNPHQHELEEDEVGPVEKFKTPPMAITASDTATLTPSSRNLDSVLMDLGINPTDPSSTLVSTVKAFHNNSSNNNCDNTILTTNGNNGYGSKKTSSVADNHINHEENHEDEPEEETIETLPLEKHLEEGYGEFDFIDERELTLTRMYDVGEVLENNNQKQQSNNKPTLRTTQQPQPPQHNLAEEIFDELSKSSTFKRNPNFQPATTTTTATKKKILRPTSGDILSLCNGLNLGGNDDTVQKPPPPPPYDRSKAPFNLGEDFQPLRRRDLHASASRLANSSKWRDSYNGGSSGSGNLFNTTTCPSPTSFYATTSRRKQALRQRRQRRLSSSSFSGTYSSSGNNSFNDEDEDQNGEINEFTGGDFHLYLNDEDEDEGGFLTRIPPQHQQHQQTVMLRQHQQQQQQRNDHQYHRYSNWMETMGYRRLIPTYVHVECA